MELYIRKKNIINLDKEYDNFDSTSVQSKVIVNDNINIRFNYSIAYDNFETNEDLTVKITFDSIKNVPEIVVKDGLAVEIATSSMVNTNVATIKFNSTTPQVWFYFSLAYYNITKFEIITDEFELGTIDADINIVKTFYNDEDALFESYTKSFKLYKTEFINLDTNTLYDAKIIRDAITLLEGEMEIVDYVDNEYYSVVVKKPVNQGLTNIKELKIKDFAYDFDIEYDIYDYLDVVGETTVKYNYHISKENQVEDGFLRDYDKNDCTLINETQYFDNSTYGFNFNTYVRPVISYSYLFELAHNIAGYTYELPDIYRFDELTITTNFSKDYDDETVNGVMDFDIPITSAGPVDDGTYILVDEPLTFSGGSAIIDCNFINDIKLNNNFRITFPYTTTGTIAFSAKIRLYTLDSSHNLKTKLDEFILPVITCSPSISSYWEDLDEMDIKYHYSEYGYALTLSIFQDAGGVGITGFRATSTSGLDENIITKNVYSLQLYGTTISVNDLLSDNDMTFLNVIQSVIGLYNLQPVLKGNHISYIEKTDVFDNELINLSKNVDFNTFKETYTDTSRFSYKYPESSVNEEINNDSLSILNTKGGNLITKEQPLQLIYENNNAVSFNDQVFIADWTHFLPEFQYYDYENNTNLHIFDIFKSKNDDIKPSLMFIAFQPSLSSSLEIIDWDFNTLLNTSDINMSRTFNFYYGLWFTKNDDADLYKYNEYTNINNVETLYDEFHKDFNLKVYTDYTELEVDAYLLSSLQIKEILNYGIVIIGSYKYIIKELTISNKKSQLKLLKII